MGGWRGLEPTIREVRGGWWDKPGSTTRERYIKRRRENIDMGGGVVEIWGGGAQLFPTAFKYHGCI